MSSSDPSSEASAGSLAPAEQMVLGEHVRTIWAGTPAELEQVATRAGLLQGVTQS